MHNLSLNEGWYSFSWLLSIILLSLLFLKDTYDKNRAQNDLFSGINEQDNSIPINFMPFSKPHGIGISISICFFVVVVRVHQLKIIYRKFSMLSKGCVCTKHKRIRSGHDDKLKIHFEQVYELMFNLYTD